MFLQKTTCKRGTKTYTFWLVRESFRTPKGPRSRTLCNITKLPVSTRELIHRSLQGESLTPVSNVKLLDALDFGGLAVLREAWQKYALSGLFAGLPRKQAGRLQVRLYLHQISLILMQGLRRLAQGTYLASSRSSTLRLKLLKQAVRVRKSARRIWIQFSATSPIQELFAHLRDKPAYMT